MMDKTRFVNNLPNLDDLRVFVVVASAPVLPPRPAAGELCPAYVSKRIQLLEQSIGVRLLHRTTRLAWPSPMMANVLYHWACISLMPR